MLLFRHNRDLFHHAATFADWLVAEGPFLTHSGSIIPAKFAFPAICPKLQQGRLCFCLTGINDFAALARVVIRELRGHHSLMLAESGLMFK